MNLTEYLTQLKQKKKIGLMTHLVCGYPSLEVNYRTVSTMVEAGVDLMELQIPFSEPIADGPTMVKANQTALNQGTTVKDCLNLMREVTQKYTIPFLFMTYYNIPLQQGLLNFCQQTKEAGGSGLIVPDLPPEEAKEFIAACKEYRISPILLMSPTSSDRRLEMISRMADGFIYCVARKGVTGPKTDFSAAVRIFLRRCREKTSLPLALGFGVTSKADVDFLAGEADVAVIGSFMIKLLEKEGIEGVRSFLRTLI
ncbi:MAG: tryptophan synthase subunit alpha [bacterium]|nr:tryptophan synthase subunit alpha [bacterium]